MMGTLYLTYDLNMCIANSGVRRTVIVSEDPVANNLPNVVGGSILMPPYEAMMQLIDGNIQEFNKLYHEYLASPVPDKMIVLLIQALEQGINLLLYLDKDAEKTFATTLMEHFFYAYGIIIGTPTNQFSYDIAYDEILVSKMYIYGNISVEEFFVRYPQSAYIQDPVIVSKLIYDVHPNMAPSSSLEQYILYFNEMKNRIKANNNIYLAPAITRG